MNFEGVGTGYNCPLSYLNGCTFIFVANELNYGQNLVVEIVAYGGH